MDDMNRRRLFRLGAAGLGAAGGFAEPAQAAATRLALTPAVEEGPYYLHDAPARVDISEGLPGVPVELRLQVVDQAGAPLAGARVDIWHCDAQGRYSGFGDRPGDPADATRAAARFLRGVQAADADGHVSFRTVYPGWYPGRTTHIHYKVRVAGAAVLTSQAFLPDALNEFLYAQAADYRRSQLRDTLNRDDHIAAQAGDAGRGELADLGDRYRVGLRIVVDPEARPLPQTRHGPGFGPPGPPPHGLRGPPPPGFGRPARTREERTQALLPEPKRS
jgi:protocatechuate 3,4-dioxygenase beta subunit